MSSLRQSGMDIDGWLKWHYSKDSLCEETTVYIAVCCVPRCKRIGGKLPGHLLRQRNNAAFQMPGDLIYLNTVPFLTL